MRHAILGFLLLTAVTTIGYCLKGRYFSLQYKDLCISANNLENLQEAVIEQEDPEQLKIVISEVVISRETPTRIIVPAIGVDNIVLYGDVFSNELLDKAPVHYSMSSLPGTGPENNVAIAGHRGDRWGFFTDLDILEIGDRILLDILDYRFEYEVKWTAIVEPTDWSVIGPAGYPAITLTTCEPKYGFPTHRLVVRGELSKVYRSPGRILQDDRSNKKAS